MYDGSPNTARLNREILCRELRENPPADWDYSLPDRCAIEVAFRLGICRMLGEGRYALADFVQNKLGMYGDDGMRIFIYGPHDLTPQQVAHAIEMVAYA